MIFYSGFSLVDDDVFFKEYLNNSPYCVAGFSYGAIKAFEYTLQTDRRVDTLQLFSPAFFQNKNEKFKRLQLLGFKKDSDLYVKNFIASCFAPLQVKKIPIENGSYDELKELLEYKWYSKLLQKLHVKGITIEVFLGADDVVIDANKTKEFFQPYAMTYFINRANHFLQQKEIYE
ncbi:MAG: pimelyl-ACP methyl ester esterase BioV [Campylobacterota bacterium]|nr:pimelyl-ACP methyl ester esterase BioV [Campylobacterota bacterium]